MLVKCTIVCKICATADDRDKRDFLCTMSTRADFGLSAKDMSALQFRATKAGRYEAKLFITAEVEVLGGQKEQASVNKKRIRESFLEEKSKRRRSGLHVVPESIPSTLRSYVFGDYLSSGINKTTKRHVTCALKFSKISAQAARQVRCEAVASEEGIGFSVHRLGERILSFAMKQQTASPDHGVLASAFITTQLGFEAVMRLEHANIACFLSPEDRRVAGRALPQFLTAEKQSRRTFLPRVAIELETLGVSAADVVSLLKTSSRIRKGQLFCLDACIVAVKLKRYLDTRDDSRLRERELKAAMNERNLGIRDDSKFCADYISGKVDVDLQEIVGVMWLTDYLFEAGGRFDGHIAFSEYSDTVQSKFRQCLHSYGQRWETAIDNSLKLLPRSLR